MKRAGRPTAETRGGLHTTRAGRPFPPGKGLSYEASLPPNWANARQASYDAGQAARFHPERASRMKRAIGPTAGTWGGLHTTRTFGAFPPEKGQSYEAGRSPNCGDAGRTSYDAGRAARFHPKQASRMKCPNQPTAEMRSAFHTTRAGRPVSTRKGQSYEAGRPSNCRGAQRTSYDAGFWGVSGTKSASRMKQPAQPLV